MTSPCLCRHPRREHTRRHGCINCPCPAYQSRGLVSPAAADAIGVALVGGGAAAWWLADLPLVAAVLLLAGVACGWRAQQARKDAAAAAAAWRTPGGTR